MKFIAIAMLVFVIAGCSNLLTNGVSYSGEDRVFSKQFRSFETYTRTAQGREPGWELGFAFIPHKDGRITGVWLKNPTRGMVPVSIWDAETKALIITMQFNIADTIGYNHFVLNQPFLLEAEKKYCITVNVTSYYYHTLPFTSLPMQYNNCSLVSSVFEEAYYPRYPQNEINNVIHGLIDLDLGWKQ